MVKPALIEIYPVVDSPVACPRCQSGQATRHGLIFQGIHVLQRCTCKDCGADFLNTLPVGHDALWPITFTIDGSYRKYDNIAEGWLATPLIRSMTEDFKMECVIERKTFRKNAEDAVLLNCLDDCFGHVFVKLWNVQSLLEFCRGLSVIVLIPENFEWLLPENICEAWLVRGKLSEMSRRISNLDAFVKVAISRFSKFHLSAAKMFHDTGTIDFEQLLRTRKFDLSSFATISPCVTFVLREDRYWHSGRVEEFLNRVFIKFKLKKYFAGYFISRQNARVKSAINFIRKQNSNVKFNITGFGKKSLVKEGINDKRVDTISEAIELEWCGLYSASHVSIGVHGSHMLIPTALSAGFIEILPAHKIQHLGEDTIPRYSGRTSILLSRHVDEFISPKALARDVVNMLSFGEVQKFISQ